MAHIEYYIKILKQKTIQRDLITASYDILKDSYDESVKVDDLIDKAQTRIFDAIQTNVRNEVQSIGDAINSAMKRIEEIAELRRPERRAFRLREHRPNNHGLAALGSNNPRRASVCRKTAFSLNIARNAAVEHHMPVAFFSLEMPVIQLATRLMISNPASTPTR